MSELGRISGPMLKDNLVRDGVDLVFENTLGDNNLYLDVVTGKIGVNTDAVTRELTVNDSMRTVNLIVDNYFQIGDMVIDGVANTFTYLPTDLVTTSTVNSDSMSTTSGLRFNDNSISTTVSNSNIELRPHGTGHVELATDLDTTGDLHSTGDITFDGTITFGSATNDNVSFNADVNSDIIPDQNEMYDLGSTTNKWSELHTELVNSQLLISPAISFPGITNIATRPGNTYYVAVNGSNTNVGDHPSGPFLTVKHALNNAVSGDTIYIYPGEYEEEFPLVVPEGVTVKGTGIRAVKITPTAITNDRDAFLLNSNTTVADLTVTGFYYNSTNGTGYAFRFAPGYVLNTRSPYIQNVTVITEPNLPTIEGGRGALVDGDEISVGITSDLTTIHSDSIFVIVDGDVVAVNLKDTAMLFHSVTFIVPGSIGLYATNGVRVEWLNSFTYFASKGLYATNGTKGRIGGDGSTIKFGAEIRSIGSACVYGDVGAEGDGDQVIMYLIQHNFGYIGVGSSAINDPTAVIQDNEVVILNNAKIYYLSDDHKGDFRVGEAMVVEQETGFVTLNGIGQNVGGINQIIISDSGNIVKLLPTEVQSNNIKFEGNTISSISGAVNIDASNNIINLNQNVSVATNLTTSGNFNLDGTISIGNQTIDQVTFSAELDSDLLPKVNEQNSLGSSTLKWLDLNAVDVTLDNIKITGNKIFTTVSNSDLELTAAGLGKVTAVDSVTVDNDISILGTSTLQNISITGNLNFTGNLYQTGDRNQTGNIDLNGTLYLNNLSVNLGDISLIGNNLTTTTSNSDLNLIAAGTGQVIVPNNDVVLSQNLTIGGQFSTPSLTVQNNVNADSLFNENIQIQGNQIKTTLSNSDLELAANGTGIVLISDSAQVSQDLDVSGTAYLKTTLISGSLVHNGNKTHTGNRFQTGNLDLTGSLTVTEAAQFDNINVTDNTLATTISNSDFELTAGISNKIEITKNLQIDNDLTVTNTLNVDDITILNRLSMDKLSNGEILVDDNFITTTNSNADLELAANSSGKILINDSVQINNNLIVNTLSTLANTNIVGTTTVQNISNAAITQIGNRIQTGDFDITGTFTQSNGITQPVDIANIRLLSNRIKTIDSNSDLELRAAGTGTVNFNTNPVVFDRDLTVNDTLTLNNITVGQVNFNAISNGTILVDDNFITTTISNADLELRAHGSGIVSVPSNNLETYDLTVQGITNLKNTTFNNSLAINGTVTRTGAYTSTGNYTLTGPLTTSTEARFENYNFTDNRIFTTLSSSNVELSAAGTGRVKFNERTDASQSLTVQGDIFTGQLTVNTTLIADSFFDGDIRVKDNFITTTTSNSNLDLQGDGTGGVLTEEILFKNNSMIANTTNANIEITPAATKNVIIDKTNAVKLPNGTTAQRSTGVTGEMRYNSTTTRIEGWKAGATKPFNGVYSADKNTSVTATASSDVLAFAAAGIPAMEMTTTGMRSNGLRVNSNIDLNNNTFTTQSNGNINITPNGTGIPVLDQTTIVDNAFINLSNTLPMSLASTGFGYVKFNSTTALVIPTGDSASRPLTPEVGDLRYNTQIQSPEIFNGTTYTTLAGNATTATTAEIDDLGQLFSILLG